MKRLAAALGVLLVTQACSGGARETPPIPGETPRPSLRTDLPEALSIRFESVTGTGLHRTGWELEVLQMGSDIRVQGGVREDGFAVPVFRAMDTEEFAAFWDWVREFPLDRLRVVEDASATETGWRKRLRYDVVLGPETRHLSRNEWTRTPAGLPWLAEVEETLHRMVQDLAATEPPDTARTADEATAAIRQMIEALGDEEP
jgi:hypothetical protein